jgi:hypothetical protein
VKNTLLLCLLASRAAAAEPMTAMVWGGGATRAGALIESPTFSPAQLKEGQEECTMSLAPEGIAVAFECIISRGSCGENATVLGERRFTLRNGKIDGRYVTLSSNFPPCSGGD